MGPVVRVLGRAGIRPPLPDGSWVVDEFLDPLTANGRPIFGVFAAFAEFERELIAERARAGLAAARARGRKGGRPRKMDRATLKAAQVLLANTDETAQNIAKRFGIGTVTLYIYLNGDGSLKEVGERLMWGEEKG